MTDTASIEACLACAAECEKCAEACLLDGNEYCALLCRDCADISALCARLQERHSPFAEDFCRLCASVCEACAAECRQHESCQVCAEACERCAAECR